MKFYVKSPFNADTIIKNKLKTYPNFKESNLQEAEFIYLPITSNLSKNYKYHNHNLYKNAKYLNNFKDNNGKLCVTGDNCLANKYRFPHLVRRHFGWKSYIPKTIPFETKNVNSLISLPFNNKIYIIKPDNAFARSGITLINNFNEIKNWLRLNPKYNKWILQDYVANPLLIDGKKFHFRIYILIIQRSNNKQFETYLYDKSFAFCAPVKYNKNSKDLKCHLTGAKYCDVRLVTPRLLKSQNIQNFNQTILPQFKDIGRDCGILAEKDLQTISDNITAYHLFACDIICDTQHKLHLLEINNGCVGTEMNHLEPYMCPNGGTLHDSQVITKLFQDLVEIVLNKKSRNGFELLQKSKNKTPIIETMDSKPINSSENYKQLSIIVLLISVMLLITLLYRNYSSKLLF